MAFSVLESKGGGETGEDGGDERLEALGGEETSDETGEEGGEEGEKDEAVEGPSEETLSMPRIFWSWGMSFCIRLKDLAPTSMGLEIIPWKAPNNCSASERSNSTTIICFCFVV